jgi:hypothetical protein
MDIAAKNAFLKETASERPPVAIGHVRMAIGEVAAATGFLESLGLRWIHQGDDFAVLELRGGTHVILSRTDGPVAPGTAAPFDLMVDDVEAMRTAYAAKGISVSEITSGSIHSTFKVTGPEGYILRITSPHTAGRTV